MSYACSAPVEDDKSFATAEKKQEEAEKNGGTGGNAAPLIIKPIKKTNTSSNGFANQTKKAID